ncbi:MAG: TspO/MBR family protein [Pseudomonadota bacterium]
MDWIVFAVFLAASFCAASTGAMFGPGPWYDALEKPSWTPPNWLFPVAWTALYLASAYAAARVAMMPGAGLAMAFWAFQIAANTIWSPIFFGLRKLGAAMRALIVLWIAVVGTFVTFLLADPVAGLLIAPYVVWVSYAGALNWVIWKRNPGAEQLAAA